eukprot:scaffold3816_cov128-Skeletonema_dohrnii-CCMP3373.AAC.6
MGLMYEIFAQMWVQAYILIVVVTNAAIWYKVHTQEKVIRSINQRVLSNTMEAGLAQKKKEANWIAGFKSFWAVLVIVIFTPLQGFFNAFVFARPTYIRLRRANPELGRLQTVKMIFFTPDPMTAVKASTASSRSPFSFADMPSIRPTNRLVDDDSFVDDGDAVNGDLCAPDPIAVEDKNDEYENEDTPPGTTAKKVVFKECQSSSDEYRDTV